MRRKRNPVLTAILWIAAIAWVAVLFFFSGQTAVQSGDLSMRVLKFLLRLFPSIPYPVEVLHPILRKLAHFGIFAVEGFLLGMAMMSSLRVRTLGGALAAVCCAAMAALNEYHQSFVDGRSCELRDVGIDTGGALAGILFAALILQLIRCAARRRARRENVII